MIVLLKDMKKKLFSFSISFKSKSKRFKYNLLHNKHVNKKIGLIIFGEYFSRNIYAKKAN